MIFVCTGDLHFTDDRPKFRTDDDFLAHQIVLFERVLIKATKLGATAVLVPGDFLDKYKLSNNRVHKEVCDVMRRHPEMRVITTLGQHDLKAHDLSTYETASALHLIEHALEGQLVVLYGGESISLIDKKGKTARIYGFAYGEPETSSFLGGQWTPPHEADYTVALIHADVNDKNINDQLIYNTDLAVFGDWHQGFAVTEIDRCLAFSCGVMTPMRADEVVYDFAYAVADLDQGTVEFKKHLQDLKTFVDYDYLAHNTKTFGVKKVSTFDADAFRETVKKAQKSVASDEELLDNVTKKQKTDKKVIRLIKGYMAE